MQKLKRSKNEYREEVKKQLQESKEQDNIDEQWKEIKRSIITAAEDVIGTKDTRQNKEWFNQECKIKIDEKKEAILKWLRTKQHIFYDEYRKIRKKAQS